MATAIFAFVVAVIGALMYALAANPKVQEMGKIAFFCGLFWIVSMFSGRQIHF